MTPRGRPRHGSSDNRANILAAARALFAEHGYDRATIRAIAEQAGVDPALVYHYFADKHALLVAALLVFVAWKLYERRWLVRHYSVARVEIPELQRLLASEPVDVLVIDLRSEQAFSGSAQMVPGARRIPPGEFESHIDTMPLDKEIILYCT